MNTFPRKQFSWRIQLFLWFCRPYSFRGWNIKLEFVHLICLLLIGICPRYACKPLDVERIFMVFIINWCGSVFTNLMLSWHQVSICLAHMWYYNKYLYSVVTPQTTKAKYEFHFFSFFFASLATLAALASCLLGTSVWFSCFHAGWPCEFPKCLQSISSVW